MSFITEAELRELWQNGRGQIPVFAPGTRFSASALDFLKTHQLEVKQQTNGSMPPASGAPEWDKPSVFPVVLNGPLPVCSQCGQPLPHKPDHMTQLDAGHFAPKTTPRLIFRGRVDSLHALVQLTAAAARRFGLPELSQQLDTLAAYCREIMSAEYNLRPVAALTLIGKSEEELHQISHWPEKYLGIQHLTPGPNDHEILHWLNFLRTQAREVEICALEAFPPGSYDPSGVGASLAHSLNRLSSAIYILELYFQAGKIRWKHLFE